MALTAEPRTQKAEGAWKSILMESKHHKSGPPADGQQPLETEREAPSQATRDI